LTTVSPAVEMNPSPEYRLARACRPLVVAVLLAVAGPAAGEDETEGKKAFFSDSSTDRTPAKTAIPSYPRIARRDRIEGAATACFRITVDGRIRDVRIRNYSHRIFRRPVLKAVRASSFEPLQPDEVYSTALTCRIYRFRLEPIVASNGDPG